MENPEKNRRHKPRKRQAVKPAASVDVSNVRFTGEHVQQDLDVTQTELTTDTTFPPTSMDSPDVSSSQEQDAPIGNHNRQHTRRGLLPANQRRSLSAEQGARSFAIVSDKGNRLSGEPPSTTSSAQTVSWVQQATVDRHDSFQSRDMRTSHPRKARRSISAQGNRRGLYLDVTSTPASRTSNRQQSLAGQALSQTRHTISEAASGQFHRQLDQDDENVGVQSVNDLTSVGESALYTGERVLPPHRTKHRLPIEVGTTETAPKSGSFGASNTASRLRQRRNLRKQYMAARRGKTSAAAAGKSAEAAKKTGSFVVRHRHGIALVALAFMLIYLVNSLSACAPIVQTVINGIAIGTYPAEEADILAAERAYRAMENELQDELNNYVRYHPEYDEAQVTQQEIWHDPYALMALISAHMGDQWTVDSAYPWMERLFDRQYELTERIERQTRYQTERGPDGEEVQVPYTYTICHVTLVNNNLSHLPFYVLSRPQISMYALYMSTLGNMPDLFAGNPYASTLRDPMEYEVPEELLASDETFARLIEEAEKYIGYPYVWGGDSPETSFDCSGFISYVFTNSGVYNIGRRGATGLYDMCRKISPEEIRPGDLIFFAGTMGEDVDGVTHVGMYVGNNMMIHCGSPISYADLTDSYWQHHFFAYGRVPY